MDNYTGNFFTSMGINLGNKKLTEVEEVPEEEEYDTIVLSTGNSSKKESTRNKGFALKYSTLKIPKKILPEDYKGNKAPNKFTTSKVRNIGEIDSKYNKQYYHTQRNNDVSVNAHTVLACLEKSSEGAVEFVIDDIEIDKLGELKGKTRYYSQSWIKPHINGDSIIDIDEEILYQEDDSDLNIKKECKFVMNKSQSSNSKKMHRRNQPIVFSHTEFKKLNNKK